MHVAVRFSAYANYLVPGSVLPPVGIRPLSPVATDIPCRQLTSSCTASRRTHMHAGTKFQRRHATCQSLLEGFAPFLVTADCAVSRIPMRGLWLHTRLARVERGIEIVQVPISHIDMRKETVSMWAFGLSIAWM